MRKVYVTAKIHLIFQIDDGIKIGDVIDELGYNFVSRTDGADIVETEIQDYDVTDSK